MIDAGASFAGVGTDDDVVDVPEVESVVSAAQEWLSARTACIDEPVHDVRTSESFASSLRRLGDAETALAAAVRPLTPRCPFCGKPHAGSLPCRHCGEPDIPDPGDEP